MNRQRVFIYYASFFFIALSFSACTTTDKTSEDQNTLYLSSYRSFAFGHLPETSPEDLRFASPQFEGRIKNELRFQLPSKGLEFNRTSPDILIYFYSLPPSEDDDISMVDMPYGVSISHDLPEVPKNHNFILDFVDRNQNVLIWRSSAEIPIQSETDRNRQLPDIISKMLRSLPF